MGKIVHTSGTIGSRGVAQGAICRTCPGSCATSCMRAGVRSGFTDGMGSEFSISFHRRETGSAETEHASPFDDPAFRP